MDPSNPWRLRGRILKSLRPGTVKQFTAVLLLLVLAIPSWAAKSPEACEKSLILNPYYVHDIDTEVNTKTYYALVHKYGKKPPKTVEVTLADGSVQKVKATPELQAKMSLQKSFDIAAMGVLGKIFDLKHVRGQKEARVVENEVHKREVEATTKELLAKAQNAPTEAELKWLQQFVGFEHLTPEIVMVKTSTMDANTPVDDLGYAFRSRFNLLYIQQVSWNYRLEGLEKNKTLTSMTMMDEMAAYGKELKGFYFHLLFDANVWNVQLRLLKKAMDDFAQAKTPEEKKKILEDIAQPNVPFLAFTGIAVTKHMLFPEESMEFKRYFKNDLEDPFGLVGVHKKDESYLRHLMLFRAIEALPPGTPLEIHAHTAVHVRAWTRLGFKDTGLIKNPKYPEVEIHLLKASREEALNKIATKLKQSENLNP